MLKQTVQVLAEEAVRVEDLDPNACRETLHWANGQVSSAASDEARAEAQVAVEVAEALVKACE